MPGHVSRRGAGTSGPGGGCGHRADGGNQRLLRRTHRMTPAGTPVSILRNRRRPCSGRSANSNLWSRPWGRGGPARQKPWPRPHPALRRRGNHRQVRHEARPGDVPPRDATPVDIDGSGSVHSSPEFSRRRAPAALGGPLRWAVTARAARGRDRPLRRRLRPPARDVEAWRGPAGGATCDRLEDLRSCSWSRRSGL